MSVVSVDRLLRGYVVRGVTVKRPRVLHLPSLRDSWCQPSKPTVLLCVEPLPGVVRAAKGFTRPLEYAEWADVACELANVDLTPTAEMTITERDGRVFVEVVGVLPRG